MSTPHPAPDIPESASKPATARAELCLAMLGRLAKKALAMAEALKEGGSKESADALAEGSGAVRVTATHQGMFAHVHRFSGPKGLGEVPVFGGGKRFLF